MIIKMLLTCSIANGIAYGVITYPIIKMIKGKREEVHPIFYVCYIIYIEIYYNARLKTTLRGGFLLVILR